MNKRERQCAIQAVRPELVADVDKEKEEEKKKEEEEEEEKKEEEECTLD